MTNLQSRAKAKRGRFRDERGVAMFMTLMLVTTLSVLTVSLMFLSQSESFSSGNYRLMTQARYGAEAGVQKAADYILNTDFMAAAPNLVGLIPTTSSPVQFNGKDVILSSDPAHLSNFPDAAVIPAFQAATSGQLVAGNSTISYTSYATLLSIDQITDGYTGVAKLVQTWQITSDATIAGIRKSTVEVSAIIDSAKVPTISYGAFGTNPGCGSLSFSGHVKTNSYDSSAIDPATNLPYAGNTVPPEKGTGGDVGTNGNMTINGNVDVNGNLSSPQVGVGSCTTGNVTACTGCSLSFAQGSMIHLPQLVQLPTPKTPPISPLGSANSPITVHSCADVGLTATNCAYSGGVLTLTNTTPAGWPTAQGYPVGTPPPSLTLPFIDVGTLVLTASSDPNVSNNYNFNGINMQNGDFQIQSPGKAYGVKVNISGLNPDGTPLTTDVFHMQAGAEAGGFNVSAAATAASASPSTLCSAAACDTLQHPYTCPNCSQYDASLLQIIYGGYGNVQLQGHPSAAAVFYMPNATAVFGGNSGLNGALIASTLSINGGGNAININYDQSLSGKGQTASAPMISSFSWKKY
jgi:hypothetical protein